MLALHAQPQRDQQHGRIHGAAAGSAERSPPPRRSAGHRGRQPPCGGTPVRAETSASASFETEFATRFDRCPRTPSDTSTGRPTRMQTDWRIEHSPSRARWSSAACTKGAMEDYHQPTPASKPQQERPAPQAAPRLRLQLATPERTTKPEERSYLRSLPDQTRHRRGNLGSTSALSVTTTWRPLQWLWRGSPRRWRAGSRTPTVGQPVRATMAPSQIACARCCSHSP